MSSASVWCVECKIPFVNVYKLRAHVRKKHADKLDILCPLKKKNDCVIVCTVCSKGFTVKNNLKTHIRMKHPDIAEKKVYTCIKCSANFDKLNNLLLHKKTHRENIHELKCTLCENTSICKNDAISHYSNFHDIDIKYMKIDFATEQEFNAWKTKIEKETISSFINAHGRSKCGNKISYTCHRSGLVRRRGNDIRHLKIQGSNKINGYCPARMDVILSEEKCEVNFLSNHIGHNNDLGHLFLTHQQRKHLAAKIASKIPLPVILDEIRDSVTNSNLERIHLLRKKDLYNIEHSFHLNHSSVRHSNDAISVEAWVQEFNSSGIVLFYKSQNSVNEMYPILKQEDFVLIIMTPGQSNLLKKFGSDCICIDGTHGTNAYGFEMTTLLVLDDLREGYPCAFLISNRTDEEVMSIFFSCIKENIETDIQPKVFMSDMAESFYNAWVKVMCPAEFRLFCSWHVDQAWRKNLDKITSKDKRATVYQILRVLMQERDVNAFRIMLDNFLESCKMDEHTKNFGIYFERQYLNKITYWAYCFRLKSGLNTNMHVERMHRTIKYIYLNGKFNKRLDKAICAIMKFVRDKLFERLVVLHMGKLCTKLKDLRNRHNSSTKLNENLVVRTEQGWEVASSSTYELYLVETVKNNCTCKLVCIECETCLHKYSCTCIDSSIKWNMCKHIHLVCKYVKNQQINNNTEVLDVAEDEGRCLHIDISENDDEVSKIVETVSQEMTNMQKFEKHKEAFLAELLEKCASISTAEELDTIKKITAPIGPTLKALRSCKAIMPATTIKIPANKNIVPQRRLFSTQKKSKSTKSIPATSSTELNAVAMQLLQ